MSRFRKAVLLAAICPFMLSSSVKAQCLDWVAKTRMPTVSVRCGCGSGGQIFGSSPGNLIFDPVMKVTVFFAPYFIDEAKPWLYAGNKWILTVGENTSPAEASLPQMTAIGAWDPVSKGIIVLTQPTELNTYHTWLYQGLTWRRVATIGPPVRGKPRLVTDTNRARVLLVGGDFMNAIDLWEWDGASWIDRTPAVTLTHRYRCGAAYDSHRQRIVLFGGESISGVSNDTWEFDGTSWIERNPEHRPPARNDPAMAYDSARHVTVMFGGGFNNVFLDTWEWDGEDWTLRSPTLPDATFPGGQPQMAYDEYRGKLVLLNAAFTSDSNFTWEFPQSNPPRIEAEPEARMACLNGSSVTFSIRAAGDPPLSYRWRRNQSNLYIATSDSPTLTVTNTDFGSMGTYDCVVTNACGSVTSNPASLTICAGVSGCPSPVDVNGDGLIDGADIQRIVEVLLGL